MIRITHRVFSVGFVATLFLLPLSALAQVTTGNVTGRVADTSGGVVPGASVVLISEVHGNRLAPVKTNNSGDYTFADITADRYTVEVTAPGVQDHSGNRYRGYWRRSRGRTADHAPGRRNQRNGFRNRRSDARTDPRAVSALTLSSKLRSKSCRSVTRTSRMPWPLLRAWTVPSRLGAPHCRKQHHDERHLSHGHRQQRPDAEHEH